jgi:Zn-dependent protease
MDIIAWILAFVVAITAHEAAHAWMGDHLGDPTAKLAGRLSFNPLRHLDLYGTVLVPLLLLLFRSPFIFGWAKPVMFDPYNLKNPRKDGALIALSGPFANILLALLISAILYIISNPFSPFGMIEIFLKAVITTNVVLAIFNLIPIHPLDGGKVFIGLLPEKEAGEADVFLNRYGFIILIFLIFPTIGGTSPIFFVMSPIISFILKLLIPGSNFI